VDAVALFADCIALQREIGYELGVGLSLRNLCFTLLELQEPDEATTYLREVLQLAQKIRNVPLGLSGLVGLAQLYSLRSDWPTAVRLAAFVHHHPATEDEIRTKAADLLVTARAHLASDHLPDLSSAPPDSDLWPMVSAMIGAALP